MLMCPNCQADNDIDAKYCANCGELLIAPTDTCLDITSPSVTILLFSLLCPIVGIVFFFKERNKDYENAKIYLQAGLTILLLSICFTLLAIILIKVCGGIIAPAILPMLW